MSMTDLWPQTDRSPWLAALERYDDVVAAQGVRSLADHDQWYRNELPALLASRSPAFATREELVRLTEWKMARGVWRARNLVLVKSNDPEQVVALSADALKQSPHPTQPVKRLAELSGVGPATASALAAAAHPDVYPFFDELVAAQIPELPDVSFTLSYYAKYADAIRTRSAQLGHGWTPVMAERALWSNSGGKIARGTKQR